MQVTKYRKPLNAYEHHLLNMLFILQATESECGDMDLSGLPETAVDSDEDDDDEDVGRGTDPLMSRDIVRDCLEKDPMDRTDDDIGTLLCFELFTDGNWLSYFYFKFHLHFLFHFVIFFL